MSWLSELRRSKNTTHLHHHSRWMFRHEKPETLGILAFDTAKSMSRLISLYKSLSGYEMLRLRKVVMRGRGIAYLTSDDEGFLLTLGFAERLEDLDRSATAVSRLSQKCSDNGPVRFGQVYKDLKNGYMDMEKFNNYGSKEMEKSVDKMEKYTSLTGELYEEIETLTQLETSERKLNEWRKNNSNQNTNYDLFDNKIGNQRKLVRHLKEVSLWNQPYDKVVGLMAKVVCVLYARIYTLFGPYISKLPHPSSKNGQLNKLIHQKLFNNPVPKTSMSGPIQGSSPKVPLVRFLSRDSNVFITEEVELRIGLRHQTNHILKHNNKVFQAAPESTVGGSGLATRYANVILLAERYLNSESLIGDQTRHNLYNMLPSSLKGYVRSKLRVAWRETEDEMYGSDALAEGWREAVEGLLEWLVPIANDTLTWQAERSLEKQSFDSKPTVLLLQTLHYADLVKTEATIAEVLVGLSCIFWYDNRRLSYDELY